MLWAFVVVLFNTILIFDEKRKHYWLVMIVISAAFILVYSVKVQNQQDAYNKDRLNFEKQLTSKNAEIAQISRELAEKSDEIADLTRENLFISTGGDSFCFVVFLFLVGAPNTPDLAVAHSGKYPLQNVEIIITDYEALMSANPDIPKGRSQARAATVIDMEKIEANRTYLKLGTLSPGSITRVKPAWPLPDRDEITYSIILRTLFQSFYQHLKLRRVKGKWQRAFRVHKYGPKENLIVLLEKVPKGFPVDQSGKVNWKYYSE